MDIISEVFEPTVDNQRPYRNALGSFATGVTVVTTLTDTGPIGMTANSFSSVSLDPPMVLWCPAKSSDRFVPFTEARHYAIHVLRHDQYDLALAFARRADAFDMVDVMPGSDKAPVFDDCLARFECSTAAAHDAGDHVIMVGHVTRVLLNEGAPLIWSQRDYGTFASGV
ncbi:flavin reductase family protein [Shimia haliotis]|uniref:NADH-FMN oxidoreductase RutF, flavin reductase (DIM6/NTAB) family n=1 Tax=Shimia haliotis TaxID=1280847 RepID=A0A1I4HCH5_9RHOB|nr:flavin reductase family protein [Shimia haliotis]SFL39992.1 NADH-FMN oxidoreductase RutF, flavin reductase (DIM6/NTAB) family [Shimia haliotis]